MERVEELFNVIMEKVFVEQNELLDEVEKYFGSVEMIKCYENILKTWGVNYD